MGVDLLYKYISENTPGVEIILEPGDALIFKGCERPTWRDPMPINPKQFQFGNFWIDFNPKEDLYYHDVYFNYVLSDGSRAQCAYDMST